LHASVKSGLCKSLKWRWKKPAGPSIVLKVPNDPETKPLRDWLKNQRDPAATYFSPTGHVQAWQYRLPLPEYRAVWTAPGPVLLPDTPED
jgi:hypothetical protein